MREECSKMTAESKSQRGAPLPPRWFVRLAWSVHRALYRFTGGRRGLKRATDDGWGTMRVRTIGRRSGAERAVILGYFDDGPNLVTMAMNGWADPEPAWWLNLQANPDVTVELRGASGRYRAHAADELERPRLWARWGHYDKGLDSYAARRSRETQVVILEPLA
jgi:deazaflavin-dependent oxidoreductase (nitroreductase family)